MDVPRNVWCALLRKRVKENKCVINLYDLRDLYYELKAINLLTFVVILTTSNRFNVCRMQSIFSPLVVRAWLTPYRYRLNQFYSIAVLLKFSKGHTLCVTSRWTLAISKFYTNWDFKIHMQYALCSECRHYKMWQSKFARPSRAADSLKSHQSFWPIPKSTGLWIFFFVMGRKLRAIFSTRNTVSVFPRKLSAALKHAWCSRAGSKFTLLLEYWISF